MTIGMSQESSQLTQIIHGDCFEELDKIQSKSVDCVITDPPYSIGSSSARRSASRPMGWADINNASYWFAIWYEKIWRILKYNGSFWTFCSWRTLPIIQCAASKIGGMHLTSCLVWDKEWMGVGSTKGLREQFEMICLFAKPDFQIEDRSIGNIWSEKWASQRPHNHPSEKPVKLIKRILEVCDLPHLTVDPFMGSGTTGEACKLINKNFIGIEIEKQFVEIATKRLLSQTTLQTSYRDRSKQS